MNRAANGDVRCQICGSSDRKVLRRAAIVRPVVRDVATANGRSWDDDGWICVDDLQRYQLRYVQSLLESEKGELTELEREVVRALREQEILSKNPDAETQADRTLGERLADRIASFGGSWTFIIIFGVVLLGWMALNSYVLVTRAFDPFPYILLNLLLSTIAALQAPVIMMSQNRQETRDRLRAVQDYKINLKAELEIRQLHQKIDHLLSHQWERLIEIQKIQMELINELRDRK
jgi:uncharacterized membrane protein